MEPQCRNAGMMRLVMRLITSPMSQKLAILIPSWGALRTAFGVAECGVSGGLLRVWQRVTANCKVCLEVTFRSTCRGCDGGVDQNTSCAAEHRWARLPPKLPRKNEAFGWRAACAWAA